MYTFLLTFLLNSVVSQQIRSEFKVNSNYNETVWSIYPTVININENFLIIWQGNKTGNYDIYGKFYNNHGNSINQEFLINNTTNGDQKNPSATVFDDGSYVITWTSDHSGIDKIYAQKYDSFNNVIIPEFLVSVNATVNQGSPCVSSLLDGGFVIFWVSTEVSSNYIYGIRYNSSGNVIQNMRINDKNTFFLSNTFNPNVANLSDGGFVVIWYDYTGIYGQRFDVTGNVSAYLKFDNVTKSLPRTISDSPNVLGLKDGGFVVFWAASNSSTSVIYSRRYSSSTSSISFNQVNVITEMWQMFATTTRMNDEFVLSWNGDMNGYKNNFLRRHNDISFVDSPYISNMNQTIDHYYPKISASANGTVFTVWFIVDGSNYDIYTSIVDYPQSSVSSSSSALSSSSVASTSSTSSSESISTSVPVSTSTYTPTQIQIAPTPTQNSVQSITIHVIPQVESLNYDQNYPIYLNGQVIGTYMITGGDGTVQNSSNNTITIHLNDNVDIANVDLFTIPNNDWEFVILSGTTSTCTQYSGDVSTNDQGSFYHITQVDICNFATFLSINVAMLFI